MKIAAQSIAVFFAVLTVLTIGYSNCSQTGFQVTDSNALSSNSQADPGTGQGGNPQPIVAGSGKPIDITFGGGLTNQPMVSVTLCQPGTSNCATVSNLLLDTGSSGLRIFSSALSSGFASQLPGNNFGNCMAYGDNSVQWGPVKSADVQLAGEVAPSVPVQIVDRNFGDKGSACLNGVIDDFKQAGIYDPNDPPYFDSATNQYNGILGVNFLVHDCGTPCATYADNGLYFICSGGSCTSGKAPLSSQIVNPISLLTADNNGLVLKISAPVNGMGNSIQAQAFLGIGTNVNNTPASASLSVLTADPNEQDECFTYFQTQWNGNKICGFLDSGSNSLVFPNLTSQPIPTDSNGIYVPTSLTSYSATNIGYDGKNFSVGFSLANVKAQVGVDSILQYWGVTDPSGPISGDFDWGFPFFMGRTVYIGLEGRSSSLGSGLYWAY